jgi:hypothetical protein
MSFSTSLAPHWGQAGVSRSPGITSVSKVAWQRRQTYSKIGMIHLGNLSAQP